jgi:polyisoprenoid-binding protein YceI
MVNAMPTLNDYMVLCVLFATAGTVQAASYTVDSTHTYPSFEINHGGFSTQRGFFEKTSGSITLDRQAKSGSVNIKVDAASINTGMKLRDKVLRGEKFFNVEKYPDILFTTDSLTFDGDVPVSAVGKLTLLGVTKPVTLSILNFKCGANVLTKYSECGADVRTQFKRSEFGMTAYPASVGDEVNLRIQIEAAQDSVFQ